MLLLSPEDEDLRTTRWHICSGYARLNSNVGVDGERFLHRIIAKRMGLSDEVDHEDNNTLNCQRTNLRQATRSQNGANRKKFHFGYSRYKGVSWHTKHQKWCVQIRVNGKLKNIGYFDSELDAAKKYNQAAKMYFKEFASLNEV